MSESWGYRMARVGEARAQAIELTKKLGRLKAEAGTRRVFADVSFAARVAGTRNAARDALARYRATLSMARHLPGPLDALDMRETLAAVWRAVDAAEAADSARRAAIPDMFADLDGLV